MNNSILLPGNATFEPHLYELQELPFIVHRQMRYPAGDGCRFNLHRNIEILRFSEGSGSVVCGETTYDVTPGDVVVVNSYIAHRVQAREDITFACLIVSSDFCSENGLDVTRLDFDGMPGVEICKLFDAVMSAYDRQDSLWQPRMRCSVLSLLIELCEHYAHERDSAIAEDQTFRRVIDAIAYIKENLSHKLTVEKIAARAGFSKFYFLRLFKRVTGCTVVQYINLLRCETAKELLRTGNHTVKETALLCGFDNLSYFTGVFKKYTGTLPNAYKAQTKR